MENFEEKLREMEQQHRFTLSKISHEIRNPVTLINSFLQLMQDQHPEITHFEYWNQIISNMDFLKSLLDEISDYNRSVSIHPETINLYLFLRQIVADVAPSLMPRNIQIDLEKRSALPPVDVDPVKMKEILFNLIRNSAEAIQDHGSILLTVFLKDMCAVITVSDDGPGIPADYLPTLFDPFVTHKKEGTGLGLAITKNVIAAHNGTIDVESSRDKGTTFTMTLPL